MKYRIGCLVVLICIVLLFVYQNNYEGFKKDIDPCDKILDELDEAKSSLDEAKSSLDKALNSTNDDAGNKVATTGNKVATLSTDYKDIFNKAIKNECEIPKSKSKKSMF